MKSSNRSSRLPFSSIEPLEARVAPATISTTFVNGVLKITALSPTVATSVTVFQSGFDADLFSVMDGSTNLGTFDGVKSIQATLSDMNDNFAVGLPNTTVFRGTVTINTLEGNDAVQIPSGIFQGAVTITSEANTFVNVGNMTQIRGPLKVTSPGGGLDLIGKAETVSTTNLAFVHLANAAEVKGSLTMKTSLTTGVATQLLADEGSFIRGALAFANTGTTNSSITLSGQVLGKASFVFGNSVNTILANSTARISGGLSVKGGLGPETITINGPEIFTTTVAGGISLNLGDGNNSLSVNNTRVAGNVRVIAGAGDDSVTINSTFVAGALQTSLGTNATATGNAVTVTNFSAIFGALQINGSTGKDAVNTNGSSVLGAARVALGAGENSVLAVTTNFDSGFTYTGLADSDTVSIGGGLVRGLLSLSPGDGSNIMALSFATVHGKAIIKGGNVGFDNFSMDANTSINGTLTVNAGNGSNTTSIGNFGTITGFVYNGGIDSDGVFLQQNTSVLTADAGHYVRGRVKLGDGADTVLFALNSYLTFAIDGGLGIDTLQRPAAANILDLTTTGVETTIVN